MVFFTKMQKYIKMWKQTNFSVSYDWRRPINLSFPRLFRGRMAATAVDNTYKTRFAGNLVLARFRGRNGRFRVLLLMSPVRKNVRQGGLLLP